VTLIEVRLPDELAQRAREAGLLSDAAMQWLVEEALRSRSWRPPLEPLGTIQAMNVSPMSKAEIEAAVTAARATRRGGPSGVDTDGS
jgi:hypothetical protein